MTDYPDLFVGRITARSSADVQTVLDKVIAYEQTPTPGDWLHEAILVADDDPGSTFMNDMETAANLLAPTVTPTKLYNYDPATSVESHLNTGALMLSYSGHGSSTGWGRWNDDPNRILLRSQVQYLTNGSKQPFVTVANCINGWFTNPDPGVSRVMAEELLLREQKGAIAVWAPANLAFPTINSIIHTELYQAIFQDGVVILGEAVTVAREAALAPENAHLPLNLFEAFTYLGDPALRLDVPAAITLGTQVSANPVLAGSEVTYTLNYQVSGVNGARGVNLINTLPDHVIFQSASVTPSVINGQTLSWNLDDVPEGVYSITITALVDPDAGLQNGDTLSNFTQLTDWAGKMQNSQVATTVVTNDTSPKADFFSSAPDQLGQTTQLISLSTGTNLSYNWDFGDGNSSAIQNPSHIYAQAGTYTATLTVSNGAGDDTLSKQILIIPDAASILPPAAGFVHSSPDTVGETTTFINISQDGGDNENGVTYLWEFGDGATSDSKNPIYIYTSPASYIVRLTIVNSVGSDTTTHTVLIDEAPPPPLQHLYLPTILK